MKSLAAALLLFAMSCASHADFHLWYVAELYSNADGSVQFIEMKAVSSGQQFIANHTIRSSQGANTHSYTFPTNLPGDSAEVEGGDPYGYGGSATYKSFLIGTQGFAALGVVTPDYIVPSGFLFTTGGTLNFGEGADTWAYGTLPTDGSNSLHRVGGSAVNAPMNFAGDSGRVSTVLTSISYEGLWLRTPDTESGWGLNITHQGDILVATWFTYDTDGSGLWMIMSNGAQTSPSTYTGTLYRTTGPGFNAVPFTPIGTENYTTVGSLSLTFTDGNTGTMSYTVNGVSQSKPIGRLIYVPPGPTCTLGGLPGATPNYQDLWWNSPANSESGWGVNITHQGDILVATWFTYAAGGTAGSPSKGMWLIMSRGEKTPSGAYSGELQRTTGPAFSAVPFNPALVMRTTVGDATFTFTDANTGTFRYTVDGITQTKPITRLLYSSPVTVCR